MGKRAFICGMINYPRGSAAANYVQYLALALMDVGYEVRIISDINVDYELQIIQNDNLYKGMHISTPAFFSKYRNIKHLLFWHVLGIRNSYVYSLKKNCVNREDIVIIYSSTVEIHNAVLKLKKKIGFKSLACVTEKWEKSDFATENAWEEYHRYFVKCLPKHDMILPISKNLEQYFSEQGLKTFLIPIMADTKEFINIDKTYEKIRFVFPGNRRMKDSLEGMINGLLELDSADKEKIQFDFCGITEKEVKAIARTRYDMVRNLIIYHGWMTYEKLVELYQKAHFLFLPRKNNYMSQFNFPSKVPEVMAYGVIPVITQMGDCTTDYLKDGVNSIIFEGDTKDACKNALLRAIRLTPAEQKALSKEARNCAEKRFDYRVWSIKLNQAIKDLAH